MSNTEHWQNLQNQDFNTDNISSGWIQWKNTDVCIDLHCICGYHGHFDGAFFYFYQCPKCLTKYCIGQNIKLIPLTKQESLAFAEYIKTCELED